MKRTVYSRGPWDHEASRRAYDKGRKMILKLRANGSEAESVELDIKCVKLKGEIRKEWGGKLLIISKIPKVFY